MEDGKNQMLCHSERSEAILICSLQSSVGNHNLKLLMYELYHPVYRSKNPASSIRHQKG